MNHIEFIEKHVREELIKQGFTVAVAQGAHSRRSTCTSVCLKPIVRGEFLMMCYATAKLWAEKQQTASDKFAERRVKRNEQQAGLF